MQGRGRGGCFFVESPQKRERGGGFEEAGRVSADKIWGGATILNFRGRNSV